MFCLILYSTIVVRKTARETEDRPTETDRETEGQTEREKGGETEVRQMDRLRNITFDK